MSFRTIDDLPADLSGKRVLVRADFNIPMKNGRVGDVTRLATSVPTVLELAERGAKVLILSHFGRPKHGPDPAMSLKPVADAFASIIGRPVAFVEDCAGEAAAAGVAALAPGSIAVLENSRFHSGEETNDAVLADAIARLGDIYVNDAFSAAHRAHVTTEGLARRLPAYAGRAMEAELKALEAALGRPNRPVCAVVGGAKVSTKIEVLANLVTRVEHLAIGGGMANTFLAARGIAIGKSFHEPDFLETARNISARAEAAGCTLHLPWDVVVAREFRPHAPSRVANVNEVAADEMILDLGPHAVEALSDVLKTCGTLVWNGPLGAFETPPFDAATVALARVAAALTQGGHLVSVAGGGDTVAALNHAGVAGDFTFVSTAGGAFLEWMEGKALPGVVALEQEQMA